MYTANTPTNVHDSNQAVRNLIERLHKLSHASVFRRVLPAHFRQEETGSVVDLSDPVIREGIMRTLNDRVAQLNALLGEIEAHFHEHNPASVSPPLRRQLHSEKAFAESLRRSTQELLDTWENENEE